ncbi:MAG TPA: hypothetical protein VGE52_16145 [Pirellulales bacterium]
MLRRHPPHERPRPHRRTVQAAASLRLAELCAAIEAATGWRVDVRPTRGRPGVSEPRAPRFHLVLDGPAANDARTPRSEAQRLVEAVNGITAGASRDETDGVLSNAASANGSGGGAIREDLRAARQGKPVRVPRATLQAASFADLLRAGATSLNVEAAGFYVLEDRAKTLRLAAQVGLPPSPAGPQARPLSEAAGDLEALVGHAVVLENDLQWNAWNPPEMFRSAVCVPAATPRAVHGTAWFFHDEPRTFHDRDLLAAEQTAARLAAKWELCGRPGVGDPATGTV